MRILEINTESTWRGGERQTYYQLQGFKSMRMDVELLCLKNSLLAERCSKLGIPVNEVDVPFGAISFLAKHGKNYDIIHAQTAKGQSFAVLSRFFHRKPIVYTRRVDFVPRGIVSRRKYRNTDKVVAISGAIRDIIEKWTRKPVDVIPSAAVKRELDEERAKEFLLENNLDGKKIVATISALVPHKDHATMVKAIAELSQSRDDFIFLHFGDGVLRPEVERLIKNHNLEETYRLQGHVDNVEDFYSIFDVFVMSSREEGLGSSVLDAFLYKVPVVSTNAGGLNELLGGEETGNRRGVLCRTGDYKQLADGINKLLDNEKLVEKLSKTAHAHVLENHSLEKLSRKYLTLFEQLIV